MFNDEELINSNVRERWKSLVHSQVSDHSHYIASFSKVGDSLEQWRAYGNFCICFDASELCKSGFDQYECVYSKDDIKTWILEKQLVKEWKGNCLNDDSKRMAAYNMLYIASMKYKSEHFKTEKEVRLVSVSNYTWQYPNSPSMYVKDAPIHFKDHQKYKIPIPYVKFFLPQYPDSNMSENLDDVKTYQQMKEKKLELENKSKRRLLPIREIIIGPIPNQMDAKVACKILLTKNGYEHVNVVSSEIPFRG